MGCPRTARGVTGRSSRRAGTGAVGQGEGRGPELSRIPQPHVPGCARENLHCAEGTWGGGAP